MHWKKCHKCRLCSFVKFQICFLRLQTSFQKKHTQICCCKVRLKSVKKQLNYWLKVNSGSVIYFRMFNPFQYRVMAWMVRRITGTRLPKIYMVTLHRKPLDAICLSLLFHLKWEILFSRQCISWPKPGNQFLHQN